MRPRISPVVLNIMIVNVLVWLFIQLNYDQFAITCGPDIGWSRFILLFKSGFWSDLLVPVGRGYADCNHFEPVQLVSSMFSHKDLMHLFFNMFTLYSLGTAVEMVMGSRNFAILYLFSGLFGTTITYLLDPSPNPVLGASGALFGVFGAVAFYFPNQRLSMLFIPIGVKARNLVIGVTVISMGLLIYNLFAPRPILGGISHFGHMAGLAGGLLLLYGNKILGIFKTRR